MDKKTVTDFIKKAREAAPKRNFKQTFELVVPLKGIDVKRAAQDVDFFVTLHYSKGAVPKICALVGPEMSDEAKAHCDFHIVLDDFKNFEGKKKEQKKLASKYDFFVAQANIMPKVAATFGRVLGPKGKMPNPKAGAVFPPKASLKPIVDNLRRTVRLSAKGGPFIQCPVGAEDSPEEQIIDNIQVVYDQIVHHLPNEENNIKAVFLKLTMGKPVKVK